MVTVRNRVEDPSGYLRLDTFGYLLLEFLSVFYCYAGGVAVEY